MTLDAHFIQEPDGVHVPLGGVSHRDEEYDSADFDILRDMQSRHFWYLGRHRFLLAALRKYLPLLGDKRAELDGIDLGGGCGGWISYLNRYLPNVFNVLALSDSSRRALELAAPVVGAEVARYQIDLLNLGWQNRWDVAFLLDVLEHIPADADALKQICDSLRPGGLLFVTTPALQRFWSYNDTMARHVRRYSKADFAALAQQAGLELTSVRYFNFFLSPLQLASRLKKVDVAAMTPGQVLEFMKRTHRVPAAPINAALSAIFASETPLGLWMPFPWGMSILGVFRKPL